MLVYSHSFKDYLGMKPNFTKYVMGNCCFTFLLQIYFYKKCFWEKNISKVDRLLLAAMSIKWLIVCYQVVCKISGMRPRGKSFTVAHVSTGSDVLHTALRKFRLRHVDPSLFCLLEIDKESGGKRTFNLYSLNIVLWMKVGSRSIEMIDCFFFSYEKILENLWYKCGRSLVILWYKCA